jgi:hypothetical protein
MDFNYPSAAEHVRNLVDLRAKYEVLEVHGKFRLVRIEPPFFEGSEYWVVNEKGFLWEPADSLEAARLYLDTPEAREYEKEPEGQTAQDQDEGAAAT